MKLYMHTVNDRPGSWNPDRGRVLQAVGVVRLCTLEQIHKEQRASPGIYGVTLGYLEVDVPEPEARAGALAEDVVGRQLGREGAELAGGEP